MTTKTERVRAASEARARWLARYVAAMNDSAAKRDAWYQELRLRQDRRRAERLVDDERWRGLCQDYSLSLAHLSALITQSAGIE